MNTKIIDQYPNDPDAPGDECIVISGKQATTFYDITPFMAQLREKFPAPPGCEWTKIDTCHAQIVRVK